MPDGAPRQWSTPGHHRVEPPVVSPQFEAAQRARGVHDQPRAVGVGPAANSRSGASVPRASTCSTTSNRASSGSVLRSASSPPTPGPKSENSAGSSSAGPAGEVHDLVHDRGEGRVELTDQRQWSARAARANRARSVRRPPAGAAAGRNRPGPSDFAMVEPRSQRTGPWPFATGSWLLEAARRRTWC